MKNAVKRTSKCTKCDFDHNWSGNDTTMSDFNVDFENGDMGTFTTASRSDVPFKAGVVATYIVGKNNRGFHTIEPATKDKVGILVGAAMNVASRLVAAQAQVGQGQLSQETMLTRLESYTRHIYALSGHLTDEYEGEPAPEPAPAPEHPVAQHIKDILKRNKELIAPLNKQVDREHSKAFCEDIYNAVNGDEDQFITVMKRRLDIGKDGGE